MQIRHPAFDDMPGIQHGFFTRNGGQSDGTYSSLNCGYGSNDDRQQVRQNRAVVARAMSVAPDNLITAHQVHSSTALIIEAPFETETRPEVDALVTNTPGLAVSILTADCGPVLFADANAGVVAAAHAGWRGALDGVLEATIEKMQTLGARKTNITAILGPTISRPSYEVDLAFKERFLARSPDWDQFFCAGERTGHVQFDLPAFILARLEDCEIGTALSLDRCTYREADQFFSYRRSTHHKEPDYGRQISSIALIGG